MGVKFPDLVGQRGVYDTANSSVDLVGTQIGEAARTLNQAEADSAVEDGDTLYLRIYESTANQSVWAGIFHEATTDSVSMDTELYSVGSISDGASVEVHVLGDPGHVLAQRSPKVMEITATTSAALTAELNTTHLVDLSTLSASLNFVLPSPTLLGDVINIKVNAGSDAGHLVPIGDTGIKIDGGSAATEAFGSGYGRLFMDGESYKFVATATDDWTIVEDGREHPDCTITSNGSTTQSFTSGSFTHVTTSLPTVEKGNKNQGNIWDTSNKLVKARRAGRWILSMNLCIKNVTDQTRIIARVYKDLGTPTLYREFGRFFASTASGSQSIGGAGAIPIEAAVDEELMFYMFHDEGSPLNNDPTAALWWVSATWESD